MASDETSYDYIIAGAGCAGLSLASRLVSDPRLRSKRILLIDKEEKNSNDRTWCFWEKEVGFFESIVHKSWEALDFVSPTLSRRLDIKPYRYKMIRSVDFYRFCNDRIAAAGNVDHVIASVDGFRNERDCVVATAGGKEYKGRYLFNSTMRGVDFKTRGHIYLRQHFRGWVIETAHDVFNPSVATLMDFRVGQSHGTSFIYVLPISMRRALVEYTLFTRDVLPDEECLESLHSYIENYITRQHYTILEEESGEIPMTNYPFRTRVGNIAHIGTAGGYTKASTGYTFQFVQKGTREIVQALSEKDQLPPLPSFFRQRFAWYDSTLLRVLAEGKVTGSVIFSEMFRKGNANSILRFLDNESTLNEELSIMSTLPLGAFAAAAVFELLRTH